MKKEESVLLKELVQQHIFVVRKKKVMTDSDLAVLYGVETKVLNQAVKRNRERFPSDFMFKLTQKEHDILKSQFVTSKQAVKAGGRRGQPYAFTENGVAMLSSVLNSPKAVQVNIEIMRAFTKIREFSLSHTKLWNKMNELERAYDARFKVVFEALRELVRDEEKPKRKIGFKSSPAVE